MVLILYIILNNLIGFKLLTNLITKLNKNVNALLQTDEIKVLQLMLVVNQTKKKDLFSFFNVFEVKKIYNSFKGLKK